MDRVFHGVLRKCVQDRVDMKKNPENTHINTFYLVFGDFDFFSTEHLFLLQKWTKKFKNYHFFVHNFL